MPFEITKLLWGTAIAVDPTQSHHVATAYCGVEKQNFVHKTHRTDENEALQEVELWLLTFA